MIGISRKIMATLNALMRLWRLYSRVCTATLMVVHDLVDILSLHLRIPIVVIGELQHYRNCRCFSIFIPGLFRQVMITVLSLQNISFFLGFPGKANAWGFRWRWEDRHWKVRQPGTLFSYWRSTDCRWFIWTNVPRRNTLSIAIYLLLKATFPLRVFNKVEPTKPKIENITTPMKA